MKDVYKILISGLIIFNVIMFLAAYSQKMVIRQYKADLVIETAALEVAVEKNLRYETIIADMMQGQWTPEMGLLKTFEEEWYGTPIWSWKAFHRPPGSPAIDIEEILDRQGDKP